MTATTFLVTGAAGFIGSNVSAELLARGQSVIGLDNLSSGKRSNLDRLSRLAPRQFTFIEADILDASAVRTAAKACDTVIHLAAQVSVQRSIDDPQETNATNVHGFLNVMLAAAEANARRFLYASSCAVYGDNPALPLAELEAPRPMSPYAVSKLANEMYASVMGSRTGNLEILGFRFFNIFGPWQDHNSGYAAVVPKWISLCLAGRRPIMFGDGGATRDFCPVGNIVALLASVGAPGTSVEPGIYNVGTGAATSLSQLFMAIQRVLRRFGVVVPFESPEQQPWREGDILHSYADITRAQSKLGYSARIALEAGIEQLLVEEYGLRKTSAVG